VWHLFETAPNQRFVCVTSLGENYVTKRLKTGAITSKSSQAIGAPSFSPYRSPTTLSSLQLQRLPKSQVQPAPPGQRVLTIGQRIDSMER